jgi:hypothetical protein
MKRLVVLYRTTWLLKVLTLLKVFSLLPYMRIIFFVVIQ